MTEHCIKKGERQLKTPPEVQHSENTGEHIERPFERARIEGPEIIV